MHENHKICTNMHVINWEKQASIEVGTGKYLKKKKNCEEKVW